MTGPRVFVTRKIFPGALEKIGAVTDMEVWPDTLPPSYDVLLEKTRDAEGILSMLSDRIDANLIENSPNLKVISSMAVGTDNIDVAGATRRGIFVGYTPGVLTETLTASVFS